MPGIYNNNIIQNIDVTSEAQASQIVELLNQKVEDSEIPVHSSHYFMERVSRLQIKFDFPEGSQNIEENKTKVRDIIKKTIGEVIQQDGQVKS